MQETSGEAKENQTVDFYWFFSATRRSVFLWLFFLLLFNCSSGRSASVWMTKKSFSEWFIETLSAWRRVVDLCTRGYQPKYNLHMGDYITHVVGMLEGDRMKFTNRWFELIYSVSFVWHSVVEVVGFGLCKYCSSFCFLLQFAGSQKLTWFFVPSYIIDSRMFSLFSLLHFLFLC